MKNYLAPLFWILPLSVYLVACGSGSNDEVAGIDGSGSPVASSTGTIDGFGSVIVNGVRYDSSKSTILINGQVGSEDDLRTGYRVTVIGTQENDAGVADTIEFRPDVVGIITEIDLTKEQFVVLGQTVKVTNATLFDQAITPNTIEGLSVGERVLVSGKTDNSGVITASRIERTALLHQINGQVRELNDANSTFLIRDITVNYSSATFNIINDDQLTNGMRVSIRGTLSNSQLFMAQTITGIEDRFNEDVEKVELEGFITRFNSATDFAVDGVPCTTIPATTYEDGNPSELMLGVAVEVKGTVNATGTVVAKAIEFDRDDNSHIQGQVSSITLNTTGSIVTGTLQVGETTIQTTGSTRYEDKSDDQIRRFNLASIQVGNFVDVSGFNNNNVFIATKIERKRFSNDEDTEIKIEGLVTSVGIHSFTVLGNEIRTTESTEFHVDDAILTEAEFLLMALGQHVRVEGILRDGIFTATEVEIEEGDDSPD